MKDQIVHTRSQLQTIVIQANNRKVVLESEIEEIANQIKHACWDDTSYYSFGYVKKQEMILKKTKLEAELTTQLENRKFAMDKLESMDYADF